MTTNPTQTPARRINATDPHDGIGCIDTEALLADVSADNARLRAEILVLHTRLDNAIHQKQAAIDEAVEVRSHA